MKNAEEIIEFWFGPADAVQTPQAKWWKKDLEFDSLCREEFSASVDAAARGELEHWRTQPRPALAYILICDQFTRNIYRNDAKTYSLDPKALATCRKGVELGFPEKLSTLEQVFFLMPLMHAEDLSCQDEAIVQFAIAAAAAPEALKATLRQNVDYAVQHRQIVARFGRFPHRNEILGRKSTDEESVFLTQPGSSF